MIRRFIVRLSHSSLSRVQNNSYNSQFSLNKNLLIRSFARVSGGSKRAGGSKSSVPKTPKVDDDPWKPVTDVASGQIYWWNTVTNETTSLGAPNPSAVGTPPGPSNAVATPQPQQSGGMMSGLGGVVAEGFAFGVGSSLARHAVGSFFGGGGSSSAAGGGVDSSSNDDGVDDGDSWDI